MTGGVDALTITQVRRVGPSTSFLAWSTVKPEEPILGQVLETREIVDGQVMYTRRHPDDSQKVIVGRVTLSPYSGDMHAFYSHIDSFWIRSSIEPIG